MKKVNVTYHDVSPTQCAQEHVVQEHLHLHYLHLHYLRSIHWYQLVSELRETCQQLDLNRSDELYKYRTLKLR
jgi:hypothetical protein